MRSSFTETARIESHHMRSQTVGLTCAMAPPAALHLPNTPCAPALGKVRLSPWEAVPGLRETEEKMFWKPKRAIWAIYSTGPHDYQMCLGLD